MVEQERMDKFYQFIRVIMERINSHFEDQKEYIHCKEGCSLCCEKGEYPCSELEFEFLKIGFTGLDKETQQQIVNNVIQLKAEKEQCADKLFMHKCPFLINHRCSVYPFRMIICRTFGLSYYDKDEYEKRNVLKVPFCIEQGLNYSEVYDQKNKSFSTELFKKTGYKNEPLTYNLGVEFLVKKFGQEIMNLDFGEFKRLIDWL
jgi:Fe-S-cluster containining protein